MIQKTKLNDSQNFRASKALFNTVILNENNKNYQFCSFSLNDGEWNESKVLLELKMPCFSLFKQISNENSQEI